MEVLVALLVAAVAVPIARRGHSLCWGCGRRLDNRLRRYRHFHDGTCRKYLRLVHRAAQRVERHRATNVPAQGPTPPTAATDWSAPG